MIFDDLSIYVREWRCSLQQQKTKERFRTAFYFLVESIIDCEGSAVNYVLYCENIRILHGKYPMKLF